ncbi:hypothetical protein F5X96DRAFT_692170 [Biscogniauxia mediterranea]|nr:hypothetical protein F5X96DRAFT_692170 [Biscogniauxia mediterranea]
MPSSSPPPPSPTTTTTFNTTPTAILAFEPESLPDWTHFSSIPWCAALLSRPGVRPYTADLPGGCRHADPLLGGTLARSPSSTVLHHVNLLDAAESAGDDSSSSVPFPQHFDLYTLGPGLAGVPLPGRPALHGGAACLLVDATCGRVGFMHRFYDGGGGGEEEQGEGKGKGKEGKEEKEGVAMVGAYTAYTNTRFHRPAVMDGPGGTLTLVLRTRVCGVGTEGGKGSKGKRGKRGLLVRASVEGEGGKVYATGESEVVVRVWGEGRKKKEKGERGGERERGKL